MQHMYQCVVPYCTGNFSDPRPPEVDNDTHSDLDPLLLNMLVSDMSNGVELQEAKSLCSDKSVAGLEVSSPLLVSSNPLECTNETYNVDPLDIPFLTENCDISTLINTVPVSIDPTLSNTCTTDVSPMFCNSSVEDTPESSASKADTGQFNLSDCMHLFPDTLEQSINNLTDSELNQLFDTIPTQEPLSSESEPSPPPVSDASSTHLPVPENLDITRKRLASTIESDDDLPVKKSKEEKRVTHRIKNNAASRVSRAKRKERNNNVFTRVIELEEENAKLRVQVEKMEAETAKLKKLLVQKLSQ